MSFSRSARSRRHGTVSLALGALLLSGCAASPVADGESEASGRTVDTVLGEVTVPEQIDSVVVIEGRRDLDIALALGLPVVGFPVEESGSIDLELPLADAIDDAESEYGATELFIAGETNIEAIAEAAPDLIISRSDDVEPLLEELQVIAPVLAIGEQTTSTWQDDLLLVGEATGTLERAEKLIADYEARVAEVAEAYADEIAEYSVSPVGTDSDGSQIRASRLLSTVLDDLGATPSAAFADAIASEDGVEFGPEQLLDAHRDADGIVALVNDPAEWEALQSNALWLELPAVQAGNVVRSDKMTHEGGPITAMHALEVIASLYSTF